MVFGRRVLGPVDVWASVGVVVVSSVGCGRSSAGGKPADVVVGGEVIAAEASCGRIPRPEDSWSSKLREQHEECVAGHSEACVWLGWDLKTGEEGAVDHRTAAHLFECACAGGVVSGCNALGTMFEHAHGVARDAKRALDLYLFACERDDANGCSNAGAVYEYGKAGEPDIGQARAGYERACDLGNGDGCAGLGFLYARGLGVERDLSRALELYERACQRGSETGCNNIGYAYEVGQGYGKDHRKALAYYEKACAPDYAPGCVNLGLMYLYGTGVPKDVPQAARHFQRGCAAWHEFGRLDACTRLAALNDEAKLTLLSSEEAGKILEQGCAANLPNGCLGLGRRLLVAEPPQPLEAKPYFEKACQLGSKQGCRVLEVGQADKLW